ncbi:hypothetical protein BpHYR1_027707 [Brachionus plicatilis]|uniref:Uncharacterized protein n=1 Tax=Brachionus plicatilis TaxID=10195 RepID=A0A3M7QIJ8_BRAPC|nr:hypothetical protein BpHYR1_027707 [Brachionus plicatilis]
MHENKITLNRDEIETFNKRMDRITVNSCLQPRGTSMSHGMEIFIIIHTHDDYEDEDEFEPPTFLFEPHEVAEKNS